MPHNKSCKKRLITAKKRNEQNRQNRATMRSFVKVFRADGGGNTDEEKSTSLSKMYSMIDVHVRKGLMPKKRAARLKSRAASVIG